MSPKWEKSYLRSALQCVLQLLSALECTAKTTALFIRREDCWTACWRFTRPAKRENSRTLVSRYQQSRTSLAARTRIPTVGTGCAKGSISWFIPGSFTTCGRLRCCQSTGWLAGSSFGPWMYRQWRLGTWDAWRECVKARFLIGWFWRPVGWRGPWVRLS